MSTISQHQIDIMESRLSSRRAPWSKKGVEFLCYRSGGKGTDGELFQLLFDLYLKGTFDVLPPETTRAVMRHFTLEKLSPEAILIILLGRRPNWVKNRIQEISKSLTSHEAAGQEILSQALASGHRYINKRRNTRTTGSQGT